MFGDEVPPMGGEMFPSINGSSLAQMVASVLAQDHKKMELMQHQALAQMGPLLAGLLGQGMSAEEPEEQPEV
jgi:hypothetical protein